MQLGQVECAVLDDPRFYQSSKLSRSFSRQILGLLVEGFLVDLLLPLVFGVVAVALSVLKSLFSKAAVVSPVVCFTLATSIGAMDVLLSAGQCPVCLSHSLGT